MIFFPAGLLCELEGTNISNEMPVKRYIETWFIG
jgi:hypothetical protein